SWGVRPTQRIRQIARTRGSRPGALSWRGRAAASTAGGAAVRVAIEPDAESAAQVAATCIAAAVRRKPHCVLALATGSTMIPVYHALVEISRRERLSFARTTAFHLDEYAGLAG